jgi:hypothetical protein
MSYNVYKLLHLLGGAMVFVSLGGIAVHAIGGGGKESNPARKPLAILHGIGLALLIIAGFGMLARLGLSMSAGWIWTKVVIWVVLGAASTLPYRSEQLARTLLVLLPILGLLAGYLAIYKPF